MDRDYRLIRACYSGIYCWAFRAFILVGMLVGMLKGGVVSGKDNQALQQIAMEQAITQQLQSELSRLLPEESYAVFTSVELEKQQRRRWIGGEAVSTEQPITVVEEDPVSDLPGLESVQQRKPAPKPLNSASRSYKVEDVFTLRQLNVRLVLDTSVAEDLMVITEQLVRDKLSVSYGDRSQVSFVRAQLIPPPVLATPWQSAFAWLKENIWDCIAIFGAILLILALLLRFANRFLNRQAAVPQPGVMDAELVMDHGNAGLPANLPSLASLPAASTEEAAPIQNKLNLQQVMAEFFQEVLEQPLLSRHFLCQLDSSRQAKLVSCFADSPLGSCLTTVLQPSASQAAAGASGDGIAEPEAIALIKQLTYELIQYRQLIQLQTNQRMGFMQLLQADEILRLMADYGQEEKCAVLSFLPPKLLAAVASCLPPRDRIALSHTLSQGYRPNSALVEQLEGQLSKRTHQLGEKLFSVQHSGEQVLETLISESRTDPDLMAAMLGGDQELYGRYKHLLAGIDDLAVEEPKVIGQVISELDNELIAKALSGMDGQRKVRFMDGLSPLRREVIEAFMANYGESLVQRDVEEAQRKILGAYQNYVKGERSGL